MTAKQETYLDELRHYIETGGLQVLQEKEIDYGYQLKISNGSDTCIVSAYDSGKVVLGGKKSQFKGQMQEWTNIQTAAISSSFQDDSVQSSIKSSQSNATKYVVAPDKYDIIRAALEQQPVEISWGDASVSHEVYKAEICSGGDRIFLTQFRTGTLLVQGKQSALFDETCALLDSMLVQSLADHATRYVSEEQASQLKPQIERPESENMAWEWLERELGSEILDFLPQHDRNTLVAGAMLLEAAKALRMPDYSPLVMPFARAYEGFLIQLCIHIGLADQEKISKDLRAIKVGAWLDQIPTMLENPMRDQHIESDLKTAWEGTRHLMIHSDPSRQTAIPSFAKAQSEICGVLMRAFERGYDAFVRGQIPIRSRATAEVKAEPVVETASPVEKSQTNKALTILDVDEGALVELLQDEGYDVESYDDPKNATKWRVVTTGWKIFCPRSPGDTIVVSGEGRKQFKVWYQKTQSVPVSSVEELLTRSFVPHIGADEAGKGDYFGPLVTGAVYVDSEAQMDLIRWGVRDSKSMSDSTIADLAMKIRGRCPNVVEILMPADYNAAYEQDKNLNRLLASLHARTIMRLVQETGCRVVLVDQFAAEAVLEDALAGANDLQLTQRTKGESDIAVAAASILAREAFVAAIDDFRAKSEMDIPLGSSSPDVVKVGRAIVRKWGEAALARIAKIDFKTTRKILSKESS